MSEARRIPLPDLSGQSAPRRWGALVAVSLVVILALGYLGLPANVLIGAMASGIILAVSGGAIRVPMPLFFSAQSVVGCLIGRSVSAEIVKDIADEWPIFLVMVTSVSVVCFALGWVLVKTKALPGSTGIWGTSPGAALVMTIMSESYGADSRLVALMQYLRVVMVTFVATLVASLWGGPARAVAVAGIIGPDWVGLVQTLAVAACGTLIGLFARGPSGPILFPLVVGSFLNVTGVIHIELPSWLLAAAYCVVGWGIGLRFTRNIVAYALRMLPKIAGSIAAVIALCGLLAVALGRIAGIDPMTAYLATSPGGMDAIAILSASMSGVNASFVMAMQVSRFVLVSLTSPPLTTYIVKRAGLAAKKDSARCDA